MLQIFAIIDDTSVMNFGKNLQHNFPKMRGGGQRPFGTFPKIHPFWRRSASLMSSDWPACLGKKSTCNKHELNKSSYKRAAQISLSLSSLLIAQCADFVVHVFIIRWCFGEDDVAEDSEERPERTGRVVGCHCWWPNVQISLKLLPDSGNTVGPQL